MDLQVRCVEETAMLQPGRCYRDWSALELAASEKEIHFQIDVFPLLSVGLLPGPADGDREQRGVQSSPARAPIPRPVHTVAAAHDGVPEGRPATHVERALQDVSAAQAHGRVTTPSRDKRRVKCATSLNPRSN